MGFDTLEHLQTRLTALQGNLAGYKTQLKQLKKRKTQIESIIKNLKSVCSENRSDTNDDLDKIKRHLEEATEGLKSISALCAKVRKDREKDISSDDNLYSALSQLKEELGNIERKIESLEQKIRTADTQISECKRGITSQKHEIASHYRSQYSSAVDKVRKAETALRKEPDSVSLKSACRSAKKEMEQLGALYRKYAGWL